MEKQNIDRLLAKALTAIEKANPDVARWYRDKRHEERELDRLGALRFICGSLDRTNKAIVCEALGIALDNI